MVFGGNRKLMRVSSEYLFKVDHVNKIWFFENLNYQIKPKIFKTNFDQDIGMVDNSLSYMDYK
jgi:hypothetical protein